jgi:hypothetical protein
VIASPRLSLSNPSRVDPEQGRFNRRPHITQKFHGKSDRPDVSNLLRNAGSSLLPANCKTDPAKGVVRVVRDGVDPSTSGFSDPWRMFHCVPVQVMGSHFTGIVKRSAM